METEEIEQLCLIYDIEEEIIFYQNASRWLNSGVFVTGDLMLTKSNLHFRPSQNVYGVNDMNRESLEQELTEELDISLDSITEIKQKKTLLFITNKLWITTLNSEIIYKFTTPKCKEWIGLLKEKCDKIVKGN